MMTTILNDESDLAVALAEVTVAVADGDTVEEPRRRAKAAKAVKRMIRKRSLDVGVEGNL